jgi:predicted GNAT family acetyltransferase
MDQRNQRAVDVTSTKYSRTGFTAREYLAGRCEMPADLAGSSPEAELTFSRLGPDLISAEHTGAPESLRGTGAAAALGDRLVDDARCKGFTISPFGQTAVQFRIARQRSTLKGA